VANYSLLGVHVVRYQSTTLSRLLYRMELGTCV